MFNSKLIGTNSAGASIEPFYNTLVYSKTNTTPVSRTGVGFRPEFIIWYAGGTSSSVSTWVYDFIRGINKRLYLSINNGEVNDTTIISIDDDGFTTYNNNYVLNYFPTNIALCFRTGAPIVTNTDGIIPTQLSANPDIGFSIATYTGNGTTASVGHGLSQAPEFTLIKRRTTVQRMEWRGYTSLIDGSNDYLLLTSSNPKIDSTETLPTSSVVHLQSNGGAETNGNTNTYVMYNFHSVDGASKVGTYVGNGGNQSIDTGFKVGMVFIKNTTSFANFIICNNKLVGNEYEIPGSSGYYSNADAPVLTSAGIDLVNGRHNNSGDTYFYIAFADLF